MIFGCGGHARNILNTIHEICEARDILLVDENSQNGEIVLGYRTMRKYHLGEKDVFVVPIGDKNKRKNYIWI